MVSFAISIGFDTVRTPLECLGWHSYLLHLRFWMVAPAAASTAVILGGVAWKLGQRAPSAWLSGLESATPWVLRLLFLIYPLVTNVAFEAWPCYEFRAESDAVDGEGGEGGEGAEGGRAVEAYLKADVDVRCGSDEHGTTQATAWVAILLYAFGMIALNGSLLFLARHAISTGRHVTSLSRAIRFLHSEFEPRFFWWELVEMLRRLVLVGLMVLMQGSTMQLLAGILFSLVFLLLQVQSSIPSDSFRSLRIASDSFRFLPIFLLTPSDSF